MERYENEHQPRFCPCCGQEWPRIIVQDLGHDLGCERCLNIYIEGRVQL